MGEQNSGNNTLAQSQLINENPYDPIIQELKTLSPIIQKELQTLRKKHAQLKKDLSIINAKQTTNNQSLTDSANNNPNNHVSHTTNPLFLEKSLKQIVHSIDIKSKHLQKVQLRLQLLSLGKELGILSDSRLSQLQKIFNHYCHYIFKSGKHVTFDRIQYEKQHLIMERFFAFIHDFHLNKFHDPLKPSKELIPKHQLILIFKKSASNSRNLQFPQFITSLQRFALLRYDYQETYDERKQKQQRERRKIKQINLRREKERERKRKQKQQQQEQQKLQQQQKAAQQENKLKQQEVSNQPNESQQPKQQTKQERKQRKKRQKEKKKKKKPEKQENQNQNQNDTNQTPKENKSDDPNNIQQNQNNDHILNQMMKKDNLLNNPNQQFTHLQKFKKDKQNNTQKNTEDIDDLKRKQILSLSKQEKIQLLFRIIQLDNPKAVEAKLRQYQKPLFKQSAQQRKSFLLDSNSVAKLKQTDLKNQIRLGELKSKLNNRKKEQIKLNVSRSITDQKYNKKRKDDYEKYLNKSLAASNHDLNSLNFKKNLLKNKNQDQIISLNMLNQSSQRQLNNLKLGLNLQRFIQAEDQDSIFLKQYGQLGKIRSSNSSYISKTPRYSVDLRKRADQMEQQQKRKEQQKLQRFALQMYKNQHYMKRFLQRKL